MEAILCGSSSRVHMEPDHNIPSPKAPVGLPFEVLGFIFAYYVETETLFHSLETLLLVSRLWNLAALGHTALWGNYHIHLGHKPTQDAWKIILPRRLERAGSAPLRIEIREVLEGIDHPYYDYTVTCAWEEEDFQGLCSCSCTGYVVACVQDLLEILAGPRGEYCERWNKLHISLDRRYGRRGNEVQWFQTSLLCNSLSHPMPLLESIHLKGFEVLRSVSKLLFSSISSLRSVHFEDCIFDSLDGANFSSAEIMIIRSITIKNVFSHTFKFDSPNRIKVIHMGGVHAPSLTIGGSLPHLHTLYLGETSNFVASNFDCPSLKFLTFPLALTCGSTMFIEKLSSSRNSPLSTVKALTLLESRSFSGPRLIHLLKPVLDELKSIESITASTNVLCITLKYISEANMQREGNQIWRNLLGTTLELFHPIVGLVARLVFDKTMRDADISEACTLYNFPDLMLPWDEFTEDLQSLDSVLPYP